MVKLKVPLFSMEAKGQLGPRLIYSMRGSGAQVRYQEANRDVNTQDQQTKRGYFTLGIALWKELPEQEKEYWAEVSRWGYANV